MRLAVLFRNALPKGSKDVLHPYIKENIVRLSKKKAKVVLNGLLFQCQCTDD